MAYVQVDPVKIVRGENNQVLQRLEFIVDSSSDLANLPECAPGSIAYSADMSVIAMYDGTQWAIIKGGD